MGADSDFGAQENKVSHHLHFFSIYLPWSDGTESPKNCMKRWYHYRIMCANTFNESNISQYELSHSVEFFAFFSCWADDMKNIPNITESHSWIHQSKGVFICIWGFVSWQTVRVCLDLFLSFYILKFSISCWTSLKQ